jgi:hypothetical protein
VEHVVLQIELFQQHFGVEDIFLVDVDVYHVIQRFDVLGHKVLNGIDFMVNKVLHAIDITGKTADAIINSDNVRFQLMDEIIQRIKR